MKVAVDAMGTEKGTVIAIEGSYAAIKENPEIQITLVGKEEKIKTEIEKTHLDEAFFSIAPAPEVISMDDSVVVVLKKKKNSSISVGINLVKERKVNAFVSAGNTGAIMAISLVILDRLKGVTRPCLAALIPTFSRKEVILVDVGANIECKPIHLFQFSVMGNAYAHKVLGIENPKVALLNIGSEENKGGDTLVETFKMLKNSSLNFTGNIEGKDITNGKVDVVVCNGLVGNIVLKFAEGLAKTTIDIMNKVTKKNTRDAIYFRESRLFKKIKSTLDYAEYGGVPLLGVNGICVIAHGASSSKAIKNAIITSYQFFRSKTNMDIEDTLKQIKV